MVPSAANTRVSLKQVEGLLVILSLVTQAGIRLTVSCQVINRLGAIFIPIGMLSEGRRKFFRLAENAYILATCDLVCLLLLSGRTNHPLISEALARGFSPALPKLIGRVGSRMGGR